MIKSLQPPLLRISPNPILRYSSQESGTGGNLLLYQPGLGLGMTVSMIAMVLMVLHIAMQAATLVIIANPE